MHTHPSGAGPQEASVSSPELNGASQRLKLNIDSIIYCSCSFNILCLCFLVFKNKGYMARVTPGVAVSTQ